MDFHLDTEYTKYFFSIKEDDLEEATQKNHQLEQNVTRLEMSVERARLEAQREAESKEGEIAEIRQSYQRRLRAFGWFISISIHKLW